EVFVWIPKICHIAFAPPVAREKSLDGRSSSRKGDVTCRHLGGHHCEEIVMSNQPVERFDERRPNSARGRHFNVTDVEKQHEHPRTRVERRLSRFGDRVWLASRFLGGRRADDDVLELIDLLRHLVLEDFEIGAGEVGYGRAVTRWIDIDANVIGPGAEGWARGLILSARYSTTRE